MSASNLATLPWACIESQPVDVRGLSEIDRAALIVSAIKVDGHWVILSRYGDDIWVLDGFTTNTPDSSKSIDFTRVSPPFRAAMKAILFRYQRRGRAGQQPPKASTLRKLYGDAVPFLQHLEALKIDRFGLVTPMVCATYIDESRARRQAHRSPGQPLSQACLLNRFQAVEALYELSQYTHEAIPLHPWPGDSSKSLAGLTGSGASGKQSSKTPLMPDKVFCTLFERAYEQVQRGKGLLDLRDAIADVSLEQRGQRSNAIQAAKNRHLAALGWEGGLAMLNSAIIDLRTACYIVLASTSGCRNHELANVLTGAHHRTEDDEGTIYHWMRSISEKTGTGVHDWMIPETAVRALRLMARWAEPYQAMIAAEIFERQRIDPRDPEIAKAQRHRHALFLGATARKANQVRTLSTVSWNCHLKTFARGCGLEWSLASHQFRRKFANYVAHSQFGDLRYLREHFAHWSMDMTLGYAMDQEWGQHLDIELFDDIQSELEDIKLGVVETWMGDEQLAGGYGRSIKRWQRNPANLAIFKSHAAMVASIAESTAIRSNGHAWCTAGDDRCVGNTERTRCSDCNSGVIGRGHAGIYRRLYDNLKGLLDCKGIGDGGRRRILRDMERCRAVLMQLGFDPESSADDD